MGTRVPTAVKEELCRPHVAHLVEDYLEGNDIGTWLQLPYCPGLQPCDSTILVYLSIDSVEFSSKIDSRSNRPFRRFLPMAESRNCYKGLDVYQIAGNMSSRPKGNTSKPVKFYLSTFTTSLFIPIKQCVSLY